MISNFKYSIGIIVFFLIIIACSSNKDTSTYKKPVKEETVNTQKTKEDKEKPIVRLKQEDKKDKQKTKKKTEPTDKVYKEKTSGVRTGCVCRDGTTSSSTGRGACSRHGGVDYWLYSK